MFGDSAYLKMSNLRSYVKKIANETAEAAILRKKWNWGMKQVRISIEWNYGTTVSLFPYLNNKTKLKILQSNQVSKIYIVATLLRNFYACLYGNQTSNYFDYSFPDNFLEQYVMQDDNITI